MITIHKNNSRLLNFTFKKPDGTAWNVPSGNILKFSVKKSVVDTATVIEKTFNGNGGNNYSIFLSGSDTNINFGVYKYDIKDTTSNLTYCNPTNFIISEVVNVGESVVGSQNEDDNVEIVVDTAIINTDYSILTNKPKINSVELSGNKTSADLSMYTKTETNSAIASAVGDITSFDYQVVDTLPATGIKGTIYLTEKTTTEQGDIYNEYLWINNAWEKIGNTSIDISGKVDKVTTTNKLYGTDNVGGQTTYDKSDFASVSDLSGKLDKVATATNLKQVYGKDKDGTQNMLNLDFTGNDGVAYKVAGRIKLNHNYSVCQYNDAVNKQDVETMISGKADVSDIPTKTSDLTNDSGFLTSHQDISGKADTSYVNTQLATKQDTLTAGTGIDITNNVISVNLTNYENEEF